jgi:hypothetical protein
MPYKNQSPRNAGFGRSKRPGGRIDYALLSGRGSSRNRLPADWRERLPDPRSYYGGIFEKLIGPNPSGWCSARCVFHDDHHPSLTMSLNTGQWHCFGCGAGGDLIGFHIRKTRKPFQDAVADLIGLKVSA